MNKKTKISAIVLTTAVIGMTSLTAFAGESGYSEGCEFGERYNGKMKHQISQGMGGKGMKRYAQ